MNGRTWFHTDEPIPPSCITKVIPLTLEMKREFVKTRHVDLDEEIIEEGRDAPLYHSMDFKKSMDVFMNDKMPAKWQHNLPRIGKVFGNSFTRNKNLKWCSNMVSLTMDQTKLSQGHKIIPLDGEAIFQYSISGKLPWHGTLKDRIAHSHDEPLSEEFVVGDITPLHKYIRSIELGSNRGCESSGWEAIQLCELVKDYSQKFGIPLKIHQKFLKYIEDTKAYWAEDDE
jgi:hypothetical protein